MSTPEKPLDSAVHNLQQDLHDDEAWVKLVYRYQDRILTWCQKQGFQLADAENVRQEVLSRLMQKLHMYDPKKGNFPTWLRRVTQHVGHNYRRKQAKSASGSGDTEQMMRLQEVQDDSESYWDQLSAETNKSMLIEAMELAKRRVSADSWKLFYLAAIDKVPGPEIATRFNISQQSVYSARHRVMSVLKEIMQELQNDGE